jgi:serine phosphatase RsbU (regulator of sigma subunit)
VDDHSYQTSSLIRLKPNTSLIMLTDGIHEAIDSSETMFSMERVQAALRDLRGASAEELVEGTLAIVSKFCHPRLPLDDMTMVALRLREPPQ